MDLYFKHKSVLVLWLINTEYNSFEFSISLLLVHIRFVGFHFLCYKSHGQFRIHRNHARF